MTSRDAMNSAAERIVRRDAETLLAHMLGRDRAWLLAHIDDPLTPAALASYELLVDRRAAREPLQYVTGEQEFYGCRLRVNASVLIPRPETEHLVEAVALWAAQAGGERTLRIADVGTGSGAIAVALATHVAGVELLAIDASEAAVAVARENVAANGCADRVTVVRGDLLEGCEPASLDAVVSNPPYVPEAEAATLEPEVVGWEPHTALFAGEDGLAIYRRLIPQARAALRPGGLLALEFGFGQRQAVAELLEGWDAVRFLDDYAAIPRVALAERAREA